MVITTFAYSYKDEHLTQYKDYKNFIYIMGDKYELQ